MAKKKAAKKTAKKAKDVLLVASKAKAAVKAQKMLCSSELIGELNDKVHCMIACAAKRAQANRRSTVKAQDV